MPYLFFYTIISITLVANIKTNIMEFIVFNNNHSSISLGSESRLLRTGYLLADKTISIGSGGTNIYLDTQLSNATIDEKIAFLLDQKNNLEESAAMNLTETINLFQKSNTVQQSQLQVVTTQKISEWLNATFTTLAQPIIANLEKSGLSALKDLADNQILQLSPQPFDKENNQWITEFLGNSIGINNSPKQTLFLIPKEAFSQIEQATSIQYLHQSSSDTFPFYLPLLELPNLNILTSTELKTVRRELEPYRLSFNKALFNWVTIIHNQEDHATQINTYFSNALAAENEKIQQAIYANELIQMCKNMQHGQDYMRINLAIGTSQQLIKGMAESNMIDIEQFNSLYSNVPETMVMPFFCTEIFDNPVSFSQEQNATTEQIYPVKKSLHVD